MDKTQVVFMAKKAGILLVGTAVGRVVNMVIEKNVEPKNQVDEAAVRVGSLAIGWALADAGAKAVDIRIKAAEEVIKQVSATSE